jgi:hypothetical protein
MFSAVFKDNLNPADMDGLCAEPTAWRYALPQGLSMLWITFSLKISSMISTLKS